MGEPRHRQEGTDGTSVPSAVWSEELRPEISVVIPTLNEAAALPLLLGDLALQTGVTLEILICDGGSADATVPGASAALRRHGLVGSVVSGAAGRGRQLNAGAARARGEWLLFLHADSRLLSPTAVADGLTALRREDARRLAGHFALRFYLPGGTRDFVSFWREVKARSGLPGTIHGDQGFLLATAFFRDLGGFREDVPILEDTLLAEAIRRRGEWRLLPADIVTSSRRFVVEGVCERLTANALLLNFAMTGHEAMVAKLPGMYRPHDCCARLHLPQIFRNIDGLLKELPWRERLRFWQRTGAFVRGNAWQPILKRSARRTFAAGSPPAAVSFEALKRFHSRFDALTDHLLGDIIAALLTWLWFRTRSRASRRGE